MGHFSFCSSNTSDDDEEEDYESEEDEQSTLPGKENLSKQEDEHAVEKEDWESEEDEDEALVSPMTKSEHQEEDVIEEEKVNERKQAEDQALEKEDEVSAGQYGDSEDEDEVEDEDEDEDEVPGSQCRNPAQQPRASSKRKKTMPARRIMAARSMRMMRSSAKCHGAFGHPWQGESNLCRVRRLWETSNMPWTQQLPARGHQPCLPESWNAPQTVHLPAPSRSRQTTVTASQTPKQSACDRNSLINCSS
jgi:hypothetical protein